MKLSCTRENLHQGLAITSHIGSKSVNLPILQNVLLKADAGGLHLTSTNLELAVSCLVRGKVDQTGEYTVPGKLFYDYVNLLPNDRIDLDLLDHALAVQCGTSKTKINGIAANEYPLIPAVTGGVIFGVNAAGFDAALGQTLFSVAMNEARPELTGVYMVFSVIDGAPVVTMAATDSYRLGEKVVPIVAGPDDEKKVIVPQRTLIEVRRIISVFRDSVDAPETIEIELTENQIAFRFGNVELTSRTLEGKYPDYRQIIPKTANTEVIVKRADLAQAVKRTSLFSKAGLFDVRLEVNVETKMLQLSATDAGRGENSVAIEAEISGPVNNIVLNYRYLLDGLNAIGTEKVAVRMIDGAAPCVLMPVEAPEEKYLYIIMPIRQ